MPMPPHLNCRRAALARSFSSLLAFALGALLLSGCETLVGLIDSISDGAECASDGQCLGGRCLTDGEGFPAGYCSTADCNLQGCSNIFGSECLLIPGQPGALCYESCRDGADCRVGYDCLAVETYQVCLPSDFQQQFAEAGTLGSACFNEADCDEGTCLTNLVGGYCSTLGCADDAACGTGRCLPLNEEAEGSGEVANTACFRACTNDRNCRYGYRCTDPDGGGGACRPVPEAESSPVRNPTGLDDGAPCTVDINCKGGTCLREAEGYAGGYCTTLDCATVGCNTPAGGGTECTVITEETACFVSCANDSGCREGYVCIGAETGAGYCGAPRSGLTPGGDGGEIEIVCASTPINGGRALSFEIGATTVAFTVVPFSETASVRPTRLLLPDGTTGANFDTDHKFLDVNPFYIESAAPVFFPAAPQFNDIVTQGGGTYTLEIQTSDASPCFYVLEKSAPGSVLDVNIYFVGVDGLSAATATSNAGYNTMIQTFERIYENAGITIGTIRAIDAAASFAEDYAIIRNLADISQLITAASNPGESLQERISVDVFLINGFAVPQAPGLLGLSLGIPGVPGFHGVAGSALVFTAEYLGSSAAQVGQTMAHEIGHFNGLRHTSEHGGTEWDPYDDTPQCSNPDRGASCPDANNLMFPFSLGTTQEAVTASQAATLRAAPHVR